MLPIYPRPDQDIEMVDGDRDDEFVNKINLRRLEQSDIDDFMVWATDDRVSNYCLWNTYTTKEEGINYIQNIAIPHPWLRAICLGNRAIGAISVTPNTGVGTCRAELGYVLASEYWGKGITTRAVKMVVCCIFREWPHMERLEAFVDVENKGSLRVLQKVGFQREGILRKYMFIKGRSIDMVAFSLLAIDFPLC